MLDTSNFFAILPSAVRYNKKLAAKSILLYAALTSLAASNGEAYASNTYLMNILDVSERTVMRLLAQLINEKYISIRYEYMGATREIQRRLITINPLPLLDLPATHALYAVIPTHILCNPHLSPQAKLLYAEISVHTPTDGFCSSPATVFAALLQTSESTIQRYMRELIQADALRVEMEYKGETKEIRRRRIYLTAAAEMAEKTREIGVESPKSADSDKEPNERDVSNTPENGQIRGGVKFDTTYEYPSAISDNLAKHTKSRRIKQYPPAISDNLAKHAKRRRIKRGKHKKYLQARRD